MLETGEMPANSTNRILYFDDPEFDHRNLYDGGA